MGRSGGDDDEMRWEHANIDDEADVEPGSFRPKLGRCARRSSRPSTAQSVLEFHIVNHPIAESQVACRSAPFTCAGPERRGEMSQGSAYRA